MLLLSFQVFPERVVAEARVVHSGQGQQPRHEADRHGASRRPAQRHVAVMAQTRTADVQAPLVRPVALLLFLFLFLFLW